MCRRSRRPPSRQCHRHWSCRRLRHGNHRPHRRFLPRPSRPFRFYQHRHLRRRCRQRLSRRSPAKRAPRPRFHRFRRMRNLSRKRHSSGKARRRQPPDTKGSTSVLCASMKSRCRSISTCAGSATIAAPIPRQAQRGRGRRQKETPFQDGRSHPMGAVGGGLRPRPSAAIAGLGRSLGS
jgi:hypothetical protein